MSIDLRCCDVSDVLPKAKWASLVHADPPWDEYNNRPGVAAPDGRYQTLSLDVIGDHIAAAWGAMPLGARLAVWCTWPLLMDWIRVAERLGLRYMTGGAWTKSDSQGVGYHWLGRSEPLLIYVKKGRPFKGTNDLGNAHVSRPTGHSEKPEDWQRAMVQRWVPTGCLVLDLYAGLAPMARACKATGRDYLGAEIDPERHRHAMAKLDGTPWCADARQEALF